MVLPAFFLSIRRQAYQSARAAKRDGALSSMHIIHDMTLPVLVQHSILP
jgi:hypothetical protein